ncbi:MAG: PstS family phosphate ABC transporter substrate-binding protein [Stigonema ocellatum SAG 48.90 = DSM 106950]|nr:PstS family phosphate ABC transporter substrate-binding protein [Stigonema ocellatum SAG 48.90 = DSM 106950]
MFINFSRLAKAASVAALTVGVAFAAQPAQKASAQVSFSIGGSTAAAGLYTGFGASNYQSIGSGAGINGFNDGSLQAGATDIPVDGAVPVANLRIVFPISPDLGGLSLTNDQIGSILRGEITNWNQVGGPDEAITIVSRAAGSSGTRAIVDSTFGGTQDGIPAGSSGEVVSIVANGSGEIGYVEQGNLGGLNSAGGPISGPTYILFDGTNPDIIDFINNIKANPDQVRALGYDPL